MDAAAWDALLARQSRPTPFMRHAYLAALQASGSATPSTGWTPCWLTLHRGEAAEAPLAAATLTWLKTHSYGEYVFDWAWAEAYQRHGLAYYPKLLGAVPFTPVPGSRLLAEDAPSRRALLEALRELTRRQQLSSAHLLFLDEAEQADARAAGWLLRSGVQFHWTNRQPTPYADWPDFLASLQREKRKKIQQERRRVQAAGITFRMREGAAITEADWDFFHHCYQLTYAAHRSTPYLTRDFFTRMAQTLPEHWLMFIPQRPEGTPVAASLVAIDRAQGTAWGRYWGATEPIDCLHFEACYYQPLQWCIAQGFARFEGGAQGEHKMARGLLPVPTASAHWLAHPQFARAVEDFLAREGQGVEAYLDELRERDPFRRTPE
ncbi:N-acetyltransferase [Ideonella sp. TBM-1]|uniref:N-acetyltransferase n=1 Tax=Ideonella livida TaxID=2707176 RepID=A0A7C9TLL4_9BURK|nr:N-acetyltransferase [Ideonella livida]